MNLKELKKTLMTEKGKIYLSDHTKKRLIKRGYTKGDIVSVIFNGWLQERQGAKKVLIAGYDTDHNPMVIVVSKESPHSYCIVTVMPPIDQYRFTECI
jgi:hypothetical protein